MTRTITVEAPAKINLTLDVFPRRSDGYHDLDSLVIKVFPTDSVEIMVGDDGEGPSVVMTTDDATLPTDGRNLVVRAASAFLSHFSQTERVTIHLRKRLPAQAGLGGGSSDAAATLRGLAALFNTSAEESLVIAATIGSDVPLFLTEGMVRMQGRGERILPLSLSPSLFGVIARPAVGVSTPEAYRLLDSLPERRPGDASERMLAILRSGASVEEIGAAMQNDFEEAVLPRFPEIASVRQMLQEAGALGTVLCGSGSAVFGLTRNAEDAGAIVRLLSGRIPYLVGTQVWHE